MTGPLFPLATSIACPPRYSTILSIHESKEKAFLRCLLKDRLLQDQNCVGFLRKAWLQSSNCLLKRVPLFQVNSCSSLKIAIVVVCSRISVVGLVFVACKKAAIFFFFFYCKKASAPSDTACVRAAESVWLRAASVQQAFLAYCADLCRTPGLCVLCPASDGYLIKLQH